MALNERSLDLITEFEGFVPTWYADAAHGWAVPTIGYGHTKATGNRPFYEDDKKLKLTQAEARAILKKDLETVYEPAIDRLVKVPLNANQRGALVSFVYNLGEGNFKSSTLLRKLNLRDYDGAAAEFKKWNKARGKVLRGLTRRRAAEEALFRSKAVAEPKAVPAPADPVRTNPVPEETISFWDIIKALFGVK